MKLLRAGAIVLLIALIGCGETRAASAFPQIDREKLKISLTRGACFGDCPDYRVTITGRGHVVFSTREESLPGAPQAHREFRRSTSVVAPGKREYDIDPNAVDELVEKFREADFFTLKDEYAASITDSPTYVLEIDTGHGKKRVLDYVGTRAGMPPSVKALEDAVDATAGTGRWVWGEDGLVEALEAQKFDFRSEEAAWMLLQSTDRGGDQTLLGFVHRGAPLDKKLNKDNYGTALLLASIRDGRASLFAELVRRGWLKKVSASRVADDFAQSGAGCSPDLVDAVVNAGISVDATSAPGGDGWMDEGSETALKSVGMDYRCTKPGTRISTAKRLLAHGADPNHRNDAGKTTIFAVEDLELLNLLIASGADPKVVDKEGYSAIFDSWNDDIVLRLLETGASAKGRYHDGKSLWEQMQDRPMPKVRAWLEAHPTELAAAKSH